MIRQALFGLVHEGSIAHAEEDPIGLRGHPARTAINGVTLPAAWHGQGALAQAIEGRLDRVEVQVAAGVQVEDAV